MIRPTADMRHIHAEIGDNLAQRRRRMGTFRNNTGPPPERRSTISSMTPSSYQVTRMRNLSGGSSGSTASGSSSGSSVHLDNQYLPSDNHMSFLEISPFANSTTVQRGESHRKLDRSLSDSESDRLGNNSSTSSSSHRSINSSRYKTELCRQFEESGSCKYGDKCQFAHGMHELRNLARHPKYKTERCRTFHTIGFCPYGPRCHFIHEDDKVDSPAKLPSSTSSGSSSPSLSPTNSENVGTFSYSETSPRLTTVNVDNRQINALTVNINNYSNNWEQQFQSLSLNGNTGSENHSNMSNTQSSSYLNKDPKTKEFDIFSFVSVFDSREAGLDNDPKPSSLNSYNVQSKLDNSPSFSDSSLLWQNSFADLSQSIRAVDSFNHSPTGSTGSDSSSSSSSGSDCCSSTESLVNACFSDRRCPVPVQFGQF